MIGNILIQVDRLSILDEALSKLITPPCHKLLNHLKQRNVLELPTYSLVCQIARFENSVVVDANRHNFDVKLELLQVLVRLQEKLNRLLSIDRYSQLSASKSLVVS